ncbi:MAG: hypothetical protein PHT69_02705 [Bacteroidales bacterium]|nr:hypothetical protein [Bacteroidales bacterium]
MNKIRVYKILKPNTIVGLDKEIKIRDVPFSVNKNVIEILEYVSSWDYIRIVFESEPIENIEVKCVYNDKN